jgi:hypothetical protein
MAISIKIFTSDDAWTGGGYELYVQFEPASVERLQSALFKLWSCPLIDGCYLEQSLEPQMQRKISPHTIDVSQQSLRGVATLNDGIKVPCSTHPIVDESGNYSAFYFSIPIGSLGKYYDLGAYPFEDNVPLDWMHGLNQWICDLANFVFKDTAFSSGAFGFIDGDLLPVN